MVPLTLKSSELVDGTIVTGPSTFYIEVNKTLKGTYDKEVWGEEKSNRVLKPAIFIAGQDGYAESRNAKKQKYIINYNQTWTGGLIYFNISDETVAGQPKHAHKRGTGSESTYKGNVPGSQPEYSFHWMGTSSRPCWRTGSTSTWPAAPTSWPSGSGTASRPWDIPSRWPPPPISSSRYCPMRRWQSSRRWAMNLRPTTRWMRTTPASVW